MILVAEITQWLASDPLNPTPTQSPSLRWWEEPVEVEWQVVEFLIPTVSSERPEPRPPRHPTVLCPVSDLQRVVQDHRDDESDGRRRGEDGIDEIIKLHVAQSILVQLRKSFQCPIIFI